MRDGTAYFMILEAVQTQPGLLHGKLEDHRGAFCAIGSYFHINLRTCLPTTLVDEVAAVNDSMPSVTRAQRKVKMMRWLRWKLSSLGMRMGAHRRTRHRKDGGPLEPNKKERPHG